MNIGQNILGSYDANIQNGNIHLEHARGEEQVSASNSTADISGLKEGAVFKGEILNITGEKVTIALENKAQLQARLQTGVELGVGDILLFSVKENTSSQIMLKPMFDSLYSAQTQVLEKALDAAGLSPTEKNFSAAKELMEAGMPVDKGSLVKLLSQSMKFEHTSMQTLTALNKMNIPVTEENIVQYERYQNYSHSFSGDIQQTADAMASFVRAFPEGMQGKTLISAAEQLIGIFSGAAQEGDAVEPDSVSVVYGESNTSLPDGIVPQNTKDAGAMQGTEADAGVPVRADAQNADVSMSVFPAAEMEENLKAGVSQKMNVEISRSEAVSYEQISEKTGLLKENITNLETMLQKAGISDRQIQTIMQGADSAEVLLKNLTQILYQIDGNHAAIRNIMVSSEYHKLFSDMIKNSWSLNPRMMKDPKEINDLYNKILKQSKAFEDAVASNGGDSGRFNQSSQNMRQNMQFMEQLNNQMLYAQMPLKLSSQYANSELYVYADKRKLMEQKDGISVMLHLDMDHLGMTDIKVTLTGTNVNARFYLNDQESVDIIADNMGQLAEKLAERGFNLTDEVIRRTPQESVNMVVDEIIDENAERSIKRYTFDMRT